MPQHKQLSGAQILVQSLLREGVSVLFGYPGGAIMPVYDALLEHRDTLRHVLVRHEQAAAHAAEGYARVSRNTGVCLTTSGPGATNLVTGIADAMIDSVPLVCITGQVPSRLLGSDAFQEIDIIGITTPVTKWNTQITDASQISAAIAKAFYIAQEGRPGPVLIDITKDAQTGTALYEPCSYEPERRKIKPPLIDAAVFDEAAFLLNNAKKPYILAGHGVLIAQAQRELVQCAEQGCIPVGCTLHGLSCFPPDNQLFVGMLGMHGNYAANVLTNDADVILAVGMRFDDRVTGDLSKYAPDAAVIHIDLDPAELHKNKRAHVPIAADAKEALSILSMKLQKKERAGWIEQFRALKEHEFAEVIRDEVFRSSGPLSMGEVVHALCVATKGSAVVVGDVGQHQMVTARYYQFKKPRSWLSSGGLGTMGFALPAALGAAIAAPNRTTVAVVGDGGFQMTLQELATIAQEKLPVKILILNNEYLGMVRQWQELFYDERYSQVEMKNPDFVRLAEAFGIAAARVNSRDALAASIDRMLSEDGPFVLEAVVEKEANVFPMVPAGAGVTEMRLR